MAGCAAAPPAPAPAPAAAEPSVAQPEPTVKPMPVETPLVEWPPIEPVAARAAETTPAPPSVRATDAPAEVRPAPGPSEPVQAAPQVAAVPPPEPPAPAAPTIIISQEPTAEEREFNALLADLQRYGGLSAEDLRRELATQTQGLNRSRSDAGRVRVAVLLTLTRQGTPDDQRALQLFETVIKGNPGTPPVKQLATVLSVQVAERMRAVREEQARSEAAIQKLEALRAMERSLLRERLRSGGGGGAGSGGN